MRRESLCCWELAIVASARKVLEKARAANNASPDAPPALRYVDLHHAARAAAALLSLQLGLELHHVDTALECVDLARILSELCLHRQPLERDIRRCTVLRYERGGRVAAAHDARRVHSVSQLLLRELARHLIGELWAEARAVVAFGARDAREREDVVEHRREVLCVGARMQK